MKCTRLDDIFQIHNFWIKVNDDLILSSRFSRDLPSRNCQICVDWNGSCKTGRSILYVSQSWEDFSWEELKSLFWWGNYDCVHQEVKVVCMEKKKFVLNGGLASVSFPLQSPGACQDLSCVAVRCQCGVNVMPYISAGPFLIKIMAFHINWIFSQSSIHY